MKKNLLNQLCWLAMSVMVQKTLSFAAMWTPVFVFAMKIMLYGSKVQKKNVYHEDCLVKICIPFCSVKICIQTRLPSALVQLICQ